MICCYKCKKELPGVTLDYKIPWACAKCKKEENDPLYCICGDKVKYKYPRNTEPYDPNTNKYLIKDHIYTVESIEIGGWISYLTLKEFPGKKFNTVLFERMS